MSEPFAEAHLVEQEEDGLPEHLMAVEPEVRGCVSEPRAPVVGDSGPDVTVVLVVTVVHGCCTTPPIEGLPTEKLSYDFSSAAYSASSESFVTRKSTHSGVYP